MIFKLFARRFWMAFGLAACAVAVPVLAAPPAPPAAEVVVVLNSGDASVTLIDKATQAPIGSYPVGKEPHHLMATPDARSLIVANAVGNDLVLIDPLTGKMQQRMPQIDDPYQIGFSPDQKWFVSNALRLDRVDIYRATFDDKTRSLKLTAQVPLPKTPSHMAFSADSRLVFITLQDSNEIAAIDLATHAVLWKMPVGNAPAGIWMTPDDKYLLVGMTGDDYVEVIDWRQRKSVKRIPSGKGAHNFRPLGDRRHVFVTNRVSSTISIIDQVKLEKVGEIAGLPPGPDCMELTADGKQLWVTFRWARKVGIIDVASRKLIKTIPVGRSPHGIYFHTRAPLI